MPFLLRPPAHPLVAGVSPGEYLDAPAAFVHPLQRAVEPRPFEVARAVAGQQHDYAGVAVVIERVFEHPQLHHSVGGFLLSAPGDAAVEEFDPHSHRFHAVPELAHLRRDRPCRVRSLQGAVRLREVQHVVKEDAHPVASVRLFLALLRETLRLYEDIGVVPVDEDALHRVPVAPCIRSDRQGCSYRACTG